MLCVRDRDSGELHFIIVGMNLVICKNGCLSSNTLSNKGAFGSWMSCFTKMAQAPKKLVRAEGSFCSPWVAREIVSNLRVFVSSFGEKL
jgi:hypothetical protein